MPGTALWRQLRGVDADWTVEVAMQANILHVLQVANWQRGADAREGKARKNYPTRILPPSQQDKPGKGKGRAVSAAQLIEFQKRTRARGET
jgi:hypothetical protein